MNRLVKTLFAAVARMTARPAPARKAPKAAPAVEALEERALLNGSPYFGFARPVYTPPAPHYPAPVVRTTPTYNPAPVYHPAPLVSSPVNNLTSGLMQQGLSADLSRYLAQNQVNLRSQPSILTPQPVPAQQFQQALNRLQPMGGAPLTPAPTVVGPGWNSAPTDRFVNQAVKLSAQSPQAAVNYMNYALSPQAGSDLNTVAGLPQLNNLTATENVSRAITNDPYISRISGQAGYNGGLNFITDKYGMKGTNGMNLSGVSQDFGLHPGVTGNLQLLGAIGGFGSPAPAGNYTTSPFMNMLIGSMGGPVGSQPQTRITYAGGPTVAPPFMAGWRPIGWQG